MIVTTTDNIEGYKITEYLGIIGQCESSSVFFGIISTKKSTEALAVRAKAELNADALIGIRYANYEDGTKGMMHLYGTAVKIEKI